MLKGKRTLYILYAALGLSIVLTAVWAGLLAAGAVLALHTVFTTLFA